MKLLKRIAKRFPNPGRVLKNKEKVHRLDCAVFNFASNVLQSEGFEVAGYRAACVEGKPITPGSPVRDLSHVQVAVLDQSSILRKWAPNNDG